MLSNRLAAFALAGACIAAAAGGSYLAARQSAASAVTLAAESAPIAAVAPASSSAPEAAVVSAPPASQPASRPIARVAAAPRTPQPARTASPQPTAPPTQAPLPPMNEGPSSAPVAPEPDLPQIAPRVAADIGRALEPLPEEEAVRFEELVVAADSVVGLEIETAISSEHALVEDQVEARVVRDVRVGDDIAIPKGSRAIGSVTAVERGGRIREQARLGIRFETLVLPDGTRVPISTETIYRLGEAPGRASAVKIGGGAMAGAILGGILGGSRGAAIGASTGAGAGTAVVYAGDRSEATFATGLEVTARFLSPVPITIER